MARGELNSDLLVTIELDGLGKFNATIRQVEDQADKAGKKFDESLNKPLSKTPQQANNAGGALRSLNYVFQDSAVFAYGFQQGLMGIGNNIPMLVEGFQRMKQESGGTAGAFKALGAQLAGPMGIITGISLLVTAVTILPSFFKDAKEEADKFNEALNTSFGFAEKFNKIEFTKPQLLKAIEETQKKINDLENPSVGFAGRLPGFKAMYSVLGGLTEEGEKQLENEKKILAFYDEKLNLLRTQEVANLRLNQYGDEQNKNLLTGLDRMKAFNQALKEVEIKYQNIKGSPLIPREFGAEIPKSNLDPISTPVPVESVVSDYDTMVSAGESASYRLEQAWQQSSQQIGQLNRNLAHGMVSAMRGASVSISSIFKDLLGNIAENFISAGFGWLFGLGLNALGVPAPLVGVLSGASQSFTGGEMNSGGGMPQFQVNVITPSADATKVYFERVNQDVLIPSTEKFKSQNTGGRNPYNKKA